MLNYAQVGPDLPTYLTEDAPHLTTHVWDPTCSATYMWDPNCPHTNMWYPPCPATYCGTLPAQLPN